MFWSRTKEITKYDNHDPILSGPGIYMLFCVEAIIDHRSGLRLRAYIRA